MTPGMMKELICMVALMAIEYAEEGDYEQAARLLEHVASKIKELSPVTPGAELRVRDVP